MALYAVVSNGSKRTRLRGNPGFRGTFRVMTDQHLAESAYASECGLFAQGFVTSVALFKCKRPDEFASFDQPEVPTFAKVAAGGIGSGAAESGLSWSVLEAKRHEPVKRKAKRTRAAGNG